MAQKPRNSDGRNVDSPANHSNPNIKVADPVNVHGGPYTKEQQKLTPRKKTY